MAFDNFPGDSETNPALRGAFLAREPVSNQRHAVPSAPALTGEGLHYLQVGETSENNRRARFYSLTKAECRQLVKEAENWKRMAAVITRMPPLRIWANLPEETVEKLDVIIYGDVDRAVLNSMEL